MTDAFGGIDLHERVVDAARNHGVDLSHAAAAALAAHAREVLRRNDELHLTSITEPAAFVDRHIGESLAGAGVLPPGVEGRLLDLGSGNGYPGLAVSLARGGLEPILVEARKKKALFLRELLERIAPRGRVVSRQVQRAADVPELAPVRVLTARALGSWERILPRLVPLLDAAGEILLWAGPEVDLVARRAAWRRLRLTDRIDLPGRERSWVWRFQSRHP